MWQAVVALNGVIVLAYVGIASVILQGLRSTRQLASNRLAVATAAIFLTCAAHHGHHALHLLEGGTPAELAAVRSAFGTWHSVAVEVAGAVIAVTYLALRRTYGTLLNTPTMFEDKVRLATEERLRDLAYSDPLTGIGNRAAFDALVDGLSPGDHVTVVFLDLDGFKKVNDTHGHEVGDRVVAELGRRLAGVLGEDERVFRFGGDEFLVVRVGSAPGRQQELVARCREAVRRPLSVRGGALVCTASLGVAQGRAGDGVPDLVRAADMAMYAAKRAVVPAARGPRPSPVVLGSD